MARRAACTRRSTKELGRPGTYAGTRLPHCSRRHVKERRAAGGRRAVEPLVGRSLPLTIVAEPIINYLISTTMNRSFTVKTHVVVRRPVAQHRRGSVGSFDNYNNHAATTTMMMFNDGPTTTNGPTTKCSGEVRKMTPPPGKVELDSGNKQLGALRFRCAHCARSFVHVGHWKLHVMGHSRHGSHHLSMPPTPTPPQQPPSLSFENGPGCVSSLRSSDSIVVSKRMPDAKSVGGATEFHHQQKRFPCQLCSKAFTREHHFKVRRSRPSCPVLLTRSRRRCTCVHTPVNARSAARNAASRSLRPALSRLVDVGSRRRR